MLLLVVDARFELREFAGKLGLHLRSARLHAGRQCGRFGRDLRLRGFNVALGGGELRLDEIGDLHGERVHRLREPRATSLVEAVDFVRQIEDLVLGPENESERRAKVALELVLEQLVLDEALHRHMRPLLEQPSVELLQHRYDRFRYIDSLIAAEPHFGPKID